MVIVKPGLSVLQQLNCKTPKVLMTDLRLSSVMCTLPQKVQCCTNGVWWQLLGMPDAFNIYRQCLLPGRPPWYTLFALQRTLRYLLPNELLAPAAGRGSLIPHFVGGLYTLCLQEHQGTCSAHEQLAPASGRGCLISHFLSGCLFTNKNCSFKCLITLFNC